MNEQTRVSRTQSWQSWVDDHRRWLLVLGVAFALLNFVMIDRFRYSVWLVLLTIAAAVTLSTVLVVRSHRLGRLWFGLLGATLLIAQAIAFSVNQRPDNVMAWGLAIGSIVALIAAGFVIDLYG